MSNDNASPVATAAAEWWAEQVGAPVFRQVRPEERDESSSATEMLLGFEAARHPVSEQAGRKFVPALAKRIDDALARGLDWYTLSVDYGPDPELAEAAAEAGVSCSRFPIKTNMWIRPDHITASRGYGARAVLVWVSPGWQRPPCGDSRQVDGYPVDEICTRPQYHDGACGGWVSDPARCAACGRTYSGHFGAGAYADPDRCRKWFDEAPRNPAGRTI